MPPVDQTTITDESERRPSVRAHGTAADYAAWRERIRTRRQEKVAATERGPDAAPPPTGVWWSEDLLASPHEGEPGWLPVADLWHQIGVAPGASLGEVTSAYRQIAKAHHPDLHMNADEITRREHAERFRFLAIAYRALRDDIEN